MTLTYENLIENFILFAKNNDNIRCAFIVGSRARNNKSADEYSDLDIVILATEPAPLLVSEDWLKEVGNPLITFLEGTAVGDGKERRVLFEGGLDVDFAIIPISLFDDFLTIPDVQGVLARGYRVLVDKEHIIEKLSLHAFSLPTLKKPSPIELNNDIQDFYYHGILTAKKLCRGELLDAKSICDNYMKNLLIRMIKWNRCAIEGWDLNTWHGLRFFEEWVQQDLINDYKCIYARYNKEEIWLSLSHTISLYEKLAKEAVHHLNYEFPFLAAQTSKEIIEKLKEVK